MAKTKIRKSQKISTNHDIAEDSSIEELKRTLENGLYIHSSPPKVAGGSGGSKIREYVRAGDIAALEEILLAGNGQSLVNQPSTDKNVRSFLKTVPAYMSKIDLVHDAAERGNLRDLKALLDRRKLSRSRDSKGIGLLHKAVLQGHKDVVDYLINQYPESVDVTDPEVLELAPQLLPEPSLKEYLSTIQENDNLNINRAFPIFNAIDRCVTKSLKGTKPPIRDSSGLTNMSNGSSNSVRKKHSRGSKDYYLYTQRFMIRPSSVASSRSHLDNRTSLDFGSPVTVNDTATEMTDKGGAFDWLKRFSSSRTDINENNVLNNNLAKHEVGEISNINNELLEGMEMELSNWDQSMGFCECVSLRSSTSTPDGDLALSQRSNIKTSRLHFPCIPPVTVPEVTEKTPLSSALRRPVILTMHVTDPNPDIPEFYVNTSQIMSRKARAIESHFQRLNGARENKSGDSFSPSDSFGSSFIKLPPISNKITKHRELKHVKIDRPPTPISPMITPSHSLERHSMNSLNKNLRNSFKSLKNHNEGEDTVSINSFSKNRNSFKKKNSLSAQNVILEEKDTSSLPRLRSSSPKSSRKKPFATSWMLVKDLIRAKDAMEQKAKKNKNKFPGDVTGVVTERPPDNDSNVPFYLKKFMTKLFHNISIGVHQTLSTDHYSREVLKQQNRIETLQTVYDHDVNFWGSMIVDKVLSSLDDGNSKAATPKLREPYALNNSFSDVVSLKEEYFDRSFETIDRTSKESEDLYLFAAKEIVKKDPRSRPGSGISTNSFML